jgi:hypothetical protein
VNFAAYAALRAALKVAQFIYAAGAGICLLPCKTQGKIAKCKVELRNGLREFVFLIRRISGKAGCPGKNAIVVFSPLAKLADELFAAFKITTYVAFLGSHAAIYAVR